MINRLPSPFASISPTLDKICFDNICIDTNWFTTPASSTRSSELEDELDDFFCDQSKLEKLNPEPFLIITQKIQLIEAISSKIPEILEKCFQNNYVFSYTHKDPKLRILTAIERGDRNTFDYLMHEKVGLNVEYEKSWPMWTPLTLATSTLDRYFPIKDSTYYVKTLLKNGANVNQTNGIGDTALILAARCDIAAKNIPLLLHYGADVNHQNQYGETALINASIGYKPKIVKLLLSQRPNVNLQDKNGNSALMHACSCQDPETVDLLLNEHANVNAQNDQGNTPLMLAIKSNDWPRSQGKKWISCKERIIKRILKEGINPLITNNQGKTALILAKENFLSQKIVDLLAASEYSYFYENMHYNTIL